MFFECTELYLVAMKTDMAYILERGKLMSSQK